MGYPPERRRRARLKLQQVVRVRPSDAHLNFDEILPTLNTTRESVYFASKNGTYIEGMRVFIIFPYSDFSGSLNRELLCRVFRIDALGQGRRRKARSDVHMRNTSVDSQTQFAQFQLLTT